MATETRKRSSDALHVNNDVGTINDSSDEQNMSKKLRSASSPPDGVPPAISVDDGLDITVSSTEETASAAPTFGRDATSSVERQGHGPDLRDMASNFQSRSMRDATQDKDSSPETTALDEVSDSADDGPHNPSDSLLHDPRADRFTQKRRAGHKLTDWEANYLERPLNSRTDLVDFTTSHERKDVFVTTQAQTKLQGSYSFFPFLQDLYETLKKCCSN